MRLNFTAMIDVVFLLLVYFVVTATFTADEGVLRSNWNHEGNGLVERPVLLPKTPIDIDVIAYGEADYRLRVAGGRHTPANFDELAKLLAGWRGGVFEADNPIVIRPVGPVRWTHVFNAFNAAVRARYSNVAFAQASGPT
jgi:biopolymer transport protein ExbD